MISACRPGLTGWRADEEDRERRGADLLRRPRQKGLSPLHRQPGHRVSRTLRSWLHRKSFMGTVSRYLLKRELPCNQKSVFYFVSFLMWRLERKKKKVLLSSVRSSLWNLVFCLSGRCTVQKETTTLASPVSSRAWSLTTRRSDIFPPIVSVRYKRSQRPSGHQGWPQRRLLLPSLMPLMFDWLPEPTAKKRKPSRSPWWSSNWEQHSEDFDSSTFVITMIQPGDQL